jgi:hypothetical protein
MIHEAKIEVTRLWGVKSLYFFKLKNSVACVLKLTIPTER